MSAARAALPFDAPGLLPFARVGGALRMGVRPEPQWRDPAPDRAARTDALRQPGTVFVEAAGKAAVAELGALTGASSDDLATIAAAGWEDWCLLSPDTDGRLRLVAGAVAFPTDWRLADKMGRDVTAIHAPIHGYADALAAGVDRFLATMGDGVFARANAFIVPTDALAYDAAAHDCGHVTPDNAGDTLFLRCERQTLRRLPATGAIAFGIGVYRAPLRMLDAAGLARLADASTPVAGEAARRGAPAYAPALRAYARARAGDRASG